ncbi:MAG: substrate-binding domain-containing protein [Spirochaetia bacterium]|nr:substrate-binding domain-containing protein [Spirochaetia bacterium]
MNLNRVRILVLVTCMVVIAAGSLIAAGAQESSAAVESPRGGQVSRYNPDYGVIPVPSKKWRIGIMEKSLINDFWLDVKNGYEQAAADYGIEVEIFAAPTESDIRAQANTLEDMLGKNYDLLCVSPITDSNLLTPLAKATKMGIPIINAIDAHIDEENQQKHGIDILSLITVDFKENTRMSVRYIAEELGSEGGECIHIMGLPGGRCAEERKLGYEEEIAQYPNLTNVGVYNGEWDRKKAMDVAADILQSHPNLKAISAANDNMAMGAYQAVKNAGREGDVVITGVDATPDGISSVMNGELDATTAFFQYQLAYMSIEAAILYLEGQFDGKPTVVFGPQENWSAANLESKVADYKEMYAGLQALE